MEKKAEQPGVGRVGPTALARALGMSQPSASELLNTGRLAKEKVPLLLDYFSDVVGPDHFGLPYSKFEADFLKSLRRLPAHAQQALHERVNEAADKIAAALGPLADAESPAPGPMSLAFMSKAAEKVAGRKAGEPGPKPPQGQGTRIDAAPPKPPKPKP